MIEKIGLAKKTPEVLTEVFTKLSYVLILDLPDFIQDFVLDLKNKMDDEIKKMLDQAAKDNQDVDEFEVLKWLLDTIDVAPEETEEVKKHQHKEVHAVLFTCFFTQLSEALSLKLSEHMRVESKPQRCVKKLTQRTYKKYFGLPKNFKLRLERKLKINFYPEKLW